MEITIIIGRHHYTVTWTQVPDTQPAALNALRPRPSWLCQIRDEAGTLKGDYQIYDDERPSWFDTGQALQSSAIADIAGLEGW